MPIYPINPGQPHRRRRPKPLTPFRGVPGLARQTEKAMRTEIEAMRAEVEAVAFEPGRPTEQAAKLQNLLDKWGSEFQRLADELGWNIALRTHQASRAHWLDQAQKALGVPVAVTFDTPQMADTLERAAVAAATYIKTIPSEHIGRVAAAMALAMRQEALPGEKNLAEIIREIGFSTQRRAKFIARDQLHKVTSTIQEAQAREIGCKTYVWRTMKDRRVVGTPGGMYPTGSKAHGNHYAREGKVYRYDKPPADGPPGNAPGDRCYAQPVLDIEAILYGD